jgi:tetratricopeptide (TPR) repeat protein
MVNRGLLIAVTCVACGAADPPPPAPVVASVAIAPAPAPPPSPPAPRRRGTLVAACSQAGCEKLTGPRYEDRPWRERSSKLVSLELYNVEKLYDVTDERAPDRPLLLFKLGEIATDLASALEAEGAPAAERDEALAKASERYELLLRDYGRTGCGVKDCARVLFHLGAVAQRRGRADEACAAYRKVLEAPSSDEPWLGASCAHIEAMNAP